MINATEPEQAPLTARLRTLLDALEIAPTHIVALLVLASAACAGTVLLWWTSRPVPDVDAGGRAAGVSAAADPVDGATTVDSPTPGGVVPTPAAGAVTVHVSGAVMSPGVLDLPATARVHDAVEAAGGATASATTDGLNLARPVRDGEQIHVPAASAGAGSTGDPGPGAGTGTDGDRSVTAGGAADTASAGGPVGPDGRPLVNLNHADAAELETLPGVGPVTAQRIIEHRQALGSFTTVDELRGVSGIGDKTFAELEPHVTV